MIEIPRILCPAAAADAVPLEFDTDPPWLMHSTADRALQRGGGAAPDAVRSEHTA